MFTWLNKQGVRGESGFVVQQTGRFTAEYRDHHKIITLSVEAGLKGGLPCIILDPDAFAKWDDGTPIGEEEQKQLLKNFTDAMAFQDLLTVVESGITCDDDRRIIFKR
jgi:hypothetical protein